MVLKACTMSDKRPGHTLNDAAALVKVWHDAETSIMLCSQDIEIEVERFENARDEIFKVGLPPDLNALVIAHLSSCTCTMYCKDSLLDYHSACCLSQSLCCTDCAEVQDDREAKGEAYGQD